MSLRITFDVFSGRPNPSVMLTPAESSDLLARIGPVKPFAAKATAVPVEPVSLGYRGLIVEQLAVPAGGLPQRFRVSAAAVNGPAGALKTIDASIEESILSNADLLARAEIPADLAATMRTHAASPKTTTATKSATMPPPLACRCAPPYEPSWWNDATPDGTGGARQYTNNCYNYACNYRSDTFAQPGKAAGAVWTQLLCPNVSAAAVHDALMPTKETTIRCPTEGHLVALCMWPTHDYHWYRMGRDGFWSHKPGAMPVTNLDNSGHLIIDPRTANRGDYTSFCGFMIVMDGHIKLL
jgi:hypothetical protein